jgi:cytochrome b
MADATRWAKVKVWDPFVRLSHWSFGLLVLGSFLTSEKDRLVPVHVRIGLAVVALVVARIVWGVVGPEPARFRAFVRGPREVVAYARALAKGRPPIHVSHNPLGGAMVVALLAVLVACAATGAVVYAGPAFEGPLAGVLTKHGAKMVKEVHEGLSGLLVALVALHVAGVLFSSWRERQNLVVGMITGRKRAPTATPDVPGASGGLALASRALRLTAAALAGLAAAAALAVLLGVPSRAHAANPVAAALLRDLEVQARRERPAFAGFSAEEGRRLYFSEHVQDGERVSCSTCHTASPRSRGRTPAGKLVDPLAPAANPARLTDRGEVEKWFRRNCKQVLGRECTAEEKGNFITWLVEAA